MRPFYWLPVLRISAHISNFFQRLLTHIVGSRIRSPLWSRPRCPFSLKCPGAFVGLYLQLCHLLCFPFCDGTQNVWYYDKTWNYDHVWQEQHLLEPHINACADSYGHANQLQRKSGGNEILRVKQLNADENGLGKEKSWAEYQLRPDSPCSPGLAGKVGRNRGWHYFC